MAIYIHDEAAQLRLRVTGDLDEAAAKVLASCWTTASSVVGDRKIVLDLTALQAVQPVGRQLLAALFQEGVELFGKSEFQTALIASITGNRREPGREENSLGRWFKRVRSAAGA